jgi:hypothetical protein
VHAFGVEITKHTLSKDFYRSTSLHHQRCRHLYCNNNNYYYYHHHHTTTTTHIPIVTLYNLINTHARAHTDAAHQPTHIVTPLHCVFSYYKHLQSLLLSIRLPPLIKLILMICFVLLFMSWLGSLTFSCTFAVVVIGHSAFKSARKRKKHQRSANKNIATVYYISTIHSTSTNRLHDTSELPTLNSVQYILMQKAVTPNTCHRVRKFWQNSK